MGKYWKSPDEEQFFEIIADGKSLGVLGEKEGNKEIERIGSLCGIQIVEASPEALIKFRAKTIFHPG